MLPKVYCPFCQKIATGTVDRVPGICLLEETEDGLETAGETDMEWDGQVTEEDDRGLTVFYCRPCGKEFAVELPVDMKLPEQIRTGMKVLVDSVPVVPALNAVKVILVEGDHERHITVTHEGIVDDIVRNGRVFATASSEHQDRLYVESFPERE